MEECTHTEKSDLLEKEIVEGKVPRMSDPPHCIHSLGAVRKANGSLRPITDCSRPEGSSINNYMSSTFKSFTYNYVQTAVDILAPSDFELLEASQTIADSRMGPLKKPSSVASLLLMMEGFHLLLRFPSQR